MAQEISSISTQSRLHWLSRLLLCWSMALLLPYSARAGEVPAAEPLVPNGSFEADADSDQWPDGWGRPKSGGSWQEESGNHFLRLTSGTPGEMVMLYQQVKIPVSVKAIQMTWRMRVTDLKRGKESWFDARFMMDFKDAEGKKLKGAPALNTGKSTDGWVEKSTAFLVPEGAVMLDLMPTLFQVQSGTMDFDNLLLVPVDPAGPKKEADAKSAARQEKEARAAAEMKAKAAADLEKSGSLISNGDFEADKKSDGWPDDWSKQKTGGSWEVEEGNHFLRLRSASPGETIMVYREISLPVTKALELTWRQRVTCLKPGKAPYFDARLMLDFKDAAGAKMKGSPSAPNSRKSTEGWVEKKTEFLVPEGAVTLEFMPALFQVESGTFDLDDITLKPIDEKALLARQAVAEAERTAAEVPAEAAQRDKWPRELHVEGNQVLDKEGKPVWLQGLNVVSLEWSVGGEQVMKATKVGVEDWKSNIIRLPVKESYWFGASPEQKDGGASYRELVDNVINLAANRGAYVLLDLHRFGAPIQEHADFWKNAAAKYKDHPAVIFDLFNEPHGISWEVWRDGGEVRDKEKGTSFQSVGMQRLIDAVRETGARNVILAGGLDWSYDLSGIAKGFELNDKGGNGIIYSTHIYPWKNDWQGKVLVVAEKHPVLVGEVGADLGTGQEDPCTWVPDMLGFVQKHKLHWTAFSFHPKASPQMLSGWDYTPSPHWGAFAKRALSGEKFEMKRMR